MGWSQPTHLLSKQYTLDVLVVLSTLTGRQPGSGVREARRCALVVLRRATFSGRFDPHRTPAPSDWFSGWPGGAGQSAIAEPGATAGTEKSAGPLLPRMSRDAMPNVNRQTSQGKQALSESRGWLPAAARSSAVNA